MKELLSWRHFIVHFAVQDLKRQHSATLLGYWWLVITYFVTIFGVAWVYAGLWKMSTAAFLPYLSAGILLWNFMANTFNESTRLFPGQVGILTNFTIPPIVFLFLLILRQIFVLGYATLVHAAVLWYSGAASAPGWNPWNFVLLPFGYLLIAACMTCLSLPVAIAAARYRDLAPLIGNLTYLLFLVSPILWQENQLPEKARYLLNYNPFVWLFRVGRPMMLGQRPEASNVLSVLAVLVVSAPLCWLLYRRLCVRLPYWVR
ncbi:MAG: ABC transporter permease [Bryobacterales bacterium]|nr:ABC transporter permease [Bryobacterales bacterium]